MVKQTSAMQTIHCVESEKNGFKISSTTSLARH